MRQISYSLGNWSGVPAKAPVGCRSATGANPLPPLPDRDAIHVATLCMLGGLSEMVGHLVSLPGLTLDRFGISRECH